MSSLLINKLPIDVNLYADNGLRRYSVIEFDIPTDEPVSINGGWAHELILTRGNFQICGHAENVEVRGTSNLTSADTITRLSVHGQATAFVTEEVVSLFTSEAGEATVNISSRHATATGHSKIKIDTAKEIYVADEATVICLKYAKQISCRGNSRGIFDKVEKGYAYEDACVSWYSGKIKATDRASISLYDEAEAHINLDSNVKIVNKSKRATVKYTTAKANTISDVLVWLDLHLVPIVENHVILHKKVSHDFKTQEGTANETLWLPGTTVKLKHKRDYSRECGEGKFHACAHAWQCDEFRPKNGDRYIGVRIKLTDLHLNKVRSFKSKITFSCGEVLYSCNELGKPLPDNNVEVYNAHNHKS